MTLTRRGWSLLGAALGLGVGSFLLGALEMLVVGIAALALIGAASLWLALTSSPRLAISRRVRPVRLHVGSEGRIDLAVENIGRRATPLLVATDWFDEGRRAARFLVPPLAPGTTGHAAYRIPTRRRGRYRVGPLTVAFSDPFGLARRETTGAGDAELVVRPRVHDIVAPVAAGSRVTAESDAPAARSMVSDLGSDFLTLRSYQVGDDLRRVHWRSSARTGELMIRQDEVRWRSHAAVVLDVDPAGYDAESFEVAVEATASVIARLVRLRRRVEVFTGAGQQLGTGGDPRHDVIDRLATISLSEGGRLPAVCEHLRTHRRVDLVVVILGDVTADTTRALGALAGMGTIVVLTRPARLTPTSSLVVVDASRMAFATAWNQSLTQSLTNRTQPAWQREHASSHP